MWAMAGAVLTDAILKEATDARKRGAGALSDPHDAEAITKANAQRLTLHELIAHRRVQILWGCLGGGGYGAARAAAFPVPRSCNSSRFGAPDAPKPSR